ncbi:RimK family alpha-L-glutamate ligase [Candidatus Woesearchaeota archaeon]|nr:RimK family alpha-L-glutamate ligase [Candidatus Woesearchaeota archaeon]
MKLKAALVSLGSVSSLWTAEAMKKYFHRVDNVNLKSVEVQLGKSDVQIFQEDKPLKDYDCVYIKGSFRYLALLRSIAQLLPSRTYTPISPEAFNLGHDKLLTQLALQKSGIPMPKTFIPATVEAAKKILQKMNFPIVMKFPQGTQGKGVVFADSISAAVSVLDALTALNQPFIIQEYIETGGADIRAFVVGDKVIASMKRVSSSPDNEKRSNIHAGGKGEPVELDSKTRLIAVKAAQIIGADICGIDLLMSPTGPLVIEVNLSPGLQGITGATKIDVADEMAKYLYKRAYERKMSLEKHKKERILTDLGIEEAQVRGVAKEIVGLLDFRANRILLPEVITEISRFKDNQDVQISAEKGKIVIRKYGPSQEEE